MISIVTLFYLSLLLIQGMLGVTAIFLAKLCNDHKYANGRKLMMLVYYLKENIFIRCVKCRMYNTKNIQCNRFVDWVQLKYLLKNCKFQVINFIQRKIYEI